MSNDIYKLNVLIERLTRQRDDARGIARVLAHSYIHHSRPPDNMLTEALAFPRGINEPSDT